MTTKSGSPKPSHVPPEPRDEQIGHDDDAELTLLQKVTNYVWATAVLCLASYGLHEIDFLNVLLASDKVNHTIIKVGLAMSVMLLFTKVYMETIKGSMMGVECTYDNNKNETHLSIFLIMISGTAFHWGLWPAYGWYTPLIMIAMSYGVVLQLIMIIPSPLLQNMFGIVAITYFLQNYAGV